MIANNKGKKFMLTLTQNWLHPLVEPIYNIDRLPFPELLEELIELKEQKNGDFKKEPSTDQE